MGNKSSTVTSTISDETLLRHTMSSLPKEFDAFRIPLEDIVAATENFAEENLLARGEKADIYAGLLLQSEVAIWKYRLYTLTLNFYEEIRRISGLKHRNLLSFIGFCDEKGKRIIVMEHAVNGSLDKYLSDPKTLTWSQRLHICFGAALALTSIDNGGKRFTILLGEDWEAKVLYGIKSESENEKSDIYSLGVILLEVLYGRKATAEVVNQCLETMAKPHNNEEGKHLDGINIAPNLRSRMHPQSLSIFSETTYKCLNEQPDNQCAYMSVIMGRLKEAFDIQWEHENLLLVEKLAYLKIPMTRIKLATNNFSAEHRVKSDRYDCVYKGELIHSDREIQGENNCDLQKKRVLISCISKHQNTTKDFFTEIGMLTSSKHPNQLPLLGFCDEDSQMILVFECAFQVTPYDYLGSSTTNRPSTILTWEQRIRICLDITHGLKYIQNMEGSPSMLHRHQVIGDTHVFLGEKLNANIYNSRLSNNNLYVSSKPSHISLWESRAGNSKTWLYDAMVYSPLIARRFVVDDIYSLGVILFQVLTGNLNFKPFHMKETVNRFSSDKGTLIMNMADPRIMEETQAYTLKRGPNKVSFDTFAEVAYQCLAETPRERPRLEDVIKSLEKALDIQVLAKLRIPLEAIHSATYNFHERYIIWSGVIGSGRHGILYKAELKYFNRSTTVAIKRIINRQDGQGKAGFLSEIRKLSKCDHPNIVPLLGFFENDVERVLVYEYASNGSLDSYLENNNNMSNFTWTKRLKMCIDIAKGLDYLHTTMEDKEKIIHRGIKIKSANILLGKNMEAMIADFGLSKVHHGNQGTDFYLDPEYAKTGRLEKASNIYSFGVVLFEIYSGTVAYDSKYTSRKEKGLASIARRHFKNGTLKELLDPKIIANDEVDFTVKVKPDHDSLYAFSTIAYECIATTQAERPTIEVVINKLEKALSLQVLVEKLRIPLEVIRSATNNFSEAYLIGSGGYGAVYKAELNYFNNRSPLAVAIKRIISTEDSQGKAGFFAEISVLSKCDHPNIVPLLGFSENDIESVLVYEYASNGSLDSYLENNNNMSNLTWTRRLKMCIDIAKGLDYLHTTMEDKEKIIHRDIKSANILLGENLEAMIADFGLCKGHHNRGASTINTENVAGTNCYVDPEYAKTGRLKKASDIYSFGVVLFEIYSGTLAYDSKYTREKEKGLAPIARRHFQNGTLKELLDPKIMDEANDELGFIVKVGPDHDSLDAFAKIANKCIAKNQVERPTIEVIIKKLEKALSLQEDRMKTFKISLEHIKAGVQNFSDDKCIIKGDYVMLYKGKIQFGINAHKKVVVKQFRNRYTDGVKFSWEHAFLNEFKVLCKYKHENIIGLVGCCIENEERIIVYDHASKGSLGRYLKDTSLSWSERLKISIDIANGLKFLHGGGVRPDAVIHRDLKSFNILLTKDWKAKICGFEHALTKSAADKEIEFVISDVSGSLGYCDPLYLETKVLTKESDIYSFGVILFEILCGRLACPEDSIYGSQFLDVLAKRHFQVARLDEIVFEGIKEQIELQSFATFRSIAFQCLHEKRDQRPTAGDVVVELQKALEFQESYERQEAELHRNYKEVVNSSKSPEIYSKLVKTYINDLLSEGILNEDDKLEIIQDILRTTRDPEKSVQLIQEDHLDS